MHSEKITELMGALNRAQQTMQKAKKDTVNPFFNKKYADLSTVWDSLEPFRSEGIVFTHCPQDAPDGYILLDTVLTHAPSGQWIDSRLKMRVAKDDPQGYGSAITYARRYALGCMTGLVTEEDDDGNRSSHVQAPPRQAMKPAVKPSDILKRSETVAEEALDMGFSPAAAKVLQQASDAPPPTPSFIWRIGKDHKDESIATIPDAYLDWFSKNGKREDHVEAANIELDRRRGQGALA